MPFPMEGWVDPVDLKAPRTGVEPATFQSRVQCSTTAPARQPILPREWVQIWTAVLHLWLYDLSYKYHKYVLTLSYDKPKTNLRHTLRWSHEFHPHLCTNLCLQIFVLNSAYTSRLEHCLLKSISSTRCLQASQLIWSTKPWYSSGKGRRCWIHCWIFTEEP